MLAEERSGATDGGGRGRGARGEGKGVHGAEPGLVERGHEAQVLDLGVLEDLVELVDGARGDLRGFEALDPLGRGRRGQARFHVGHELVVARDALRVGGEARLLLERGLAERAAEAPPLILVHDHDVDVAVLGLVRASRRDGRVAISLALGSHARVEEDGRRVREEGEARGEQVDVEVLPLPRAEAMHQRRADAPEGDPGRRQVRSGAGDPGGRIAGMTGERHEPAHSLGDGVVAGAPGMRAVLAEAGHRHVHDGGIDGADRRVAHPELGRHARQEVLHDHVRPPRELQRDRHALGALEIHGDATLVAVDGAEGGADAVLAPQHAEVIAHGRPLDLDHVRAEVAQHGGAVRPRDDPRQVEHPDALEHRAHAAGTARPRAHSRSSSMSSARVTDSGLVAFSSSTMRSVEISTRRAKAV